MTFEGSGGDDANDAGFYDSQEDDEDFDAEGSGQFIPEVIGNFGEGSRNSDIIDADAEKSPKVNEPCRPWSKDEIEVIELTTTTTTSTEKPKLMSGAARGIGVLNVVQLSILLLLMSCFVARRRSL